MENNKGMDEQHAAALKLNIFVNGPILAMIRNRAARSM
ncbi:MAG: hypothetical protein ACI9R3_004916 [Verrucomicrobiales bacterium]|jgi:hypothetical protein